MACCVKRSGGLIPKREWGGMKLFAQNQVRQDDPRMAGVYAHFGDNLADMLNVARKAGVKAVVSTVAVNLKDCAPFGSLHRPGLSAGELAEWERLYGQAIEAQQAGRWDEAVEQLSQAARIDASFAELHYRWGKCLVAQGEDGAALTQFTLACDQTPYDSGPTAGSTRSSGGPQRGLRGRASGWLMRRRRWPAPVRTNLLGTSICMSTST